MSRVHISLLIVLAVVLCVLVFCGCGVMYGVTHPFTYPTPKFLEVPVPVDAATSLPAAASEDNLGPFPWAWVFGIAAAGAAVAVGALIKAPTLVDEVIIGTAGAIGVVVLLEMARNIWHAKWVLIGTLVLIAAAIAVWKLARKYVWNGRK